MLTGIFNSIQEVINTTWPMVAISIIIIVSLRISYIVKNHEKIIIYKELTMLTFIIYILCLFQIVTFQDTVSYNTDNLIPFKEIFRYEFGSRLFIKNVLGNIIMFFPFGILAGYYLKIKKFFLPLVLSIISSTSIELVQLAIGRVFDIDDIILNVIGSMSGFFIYYQLSKNCPKTFKEPWFLNIVAVIALVLVIILLF